MILEAEVRNNLAAMANNEMPLFDFADWIDSASWNMHRDSSVDAVQLVSEIHRMLAEYDHHANASVLRSELVSLLNNVVIEAKPIDAVVAQVIYRFASSSVPQYWALPPARVA